MGETIRCNIVKYNIIEDEEVFDIIARWIYYSFVVAWPTFMILLFSRSEGDYTWADWLGLSLNTSNYITCIAAIGLSLLLCAGPILQILSSDEDSYFDLEKLIVVPWIEVSL